LKPPRVREHSSGEHLSQTAGSQDPSPAAHGEKVPKKRAVTASAAMMLQDGDKTGN
jgi:hypothetical protein